MLLEERKTHRSVQLRIVKRNQCYSRNNNKGAIVGQWGFQTRGHIADCSLKAMGYLLVFFVMQASLNSFKSASNTKWTTVRKGRIMSNRMLQVVE